MTTLTYAFGASSAAYKLRDPHERDIPLDNISSDTQAIFFKELHRSVVSAKGDVSHACTNCCYLLLCKQAIECSL
jgi:hypothetical protein